MIVREVMTTELITVTPDDTLGHAASLLRQHQFHHLPVISSSDGHNMRDMLQRTRKTFPALEGILSSDDIHMAAANGSQESNRSWQERRVAEVMHRPTIEVTPTTPVAAAAQILVERGLNYLPVMDYVDSEKGAANPSQEIRPVLVGLVTRSDLLIALARSMGAFQPGVDLLIPLPTSDLTPLAQMILLAAQLHIQIHSIILAPQEKGIQRTATVRLGTINPVPLLVSLQKAHIPYQFVDFQPEGERHV
jgi:acetoin utilization protein AcuB